MVYLVLLKLRGMDVPFWRVQRLKAFSEVMSWTFPAGTQPGQSQDRASVDVPGLPAKCVLRAAAGSVNESRQATRWWTTMPCYMLQLCRPMPRRLYLERLATVLLDNGAETCRMRAGMQVSLEHWTAGAPWACSYPCYLWPSTTSGLLAPGCV